MFFSFEGIDGSGKSTQARLLAEELRGRGYEVVEVREPGGTHLGERVRSLLLDPESEIGPRAELLLFAAARAQLVDDILLPAIERGAIVIADRFADSSVAYQGGGRELPIGKQSAISVHDINRFATCELSPRRTYLIDISVDEASRRRGRRSASDRMELDDASFFNRVRESYQSLARSHPDRMTILNGSIPISSLHAMITEDASRLLS